MFCSTCGKSVNPGLSFCNSCGARLHNNALAGREAQPKADTSLNLLISSVLSVPIAGLGVMIGLLVVMKKVLEFDNDMILAVTMMSFVLLMVAELGLVVLLYARMRSARKRGEELDSAPAITQRLPDVVMRGIGEGQQQSAREAFSSVTEHTTRTLDHVPREKGE